MVASKTVPAKRTNVQNSIMEISTRKSGSVVVPSNSKPSLRRLIHSLSDDIKTFFRQEIELAKAEAVEKATSLGRNLVVMAVGGIVAYAGAIVFLIGLGWLLAWALQQAGLQPIFAGFLGLAIVGLLVALSSAAFVLKSFKALSKESLAPQRTLHTLQRLKRAPGAAVAEPEPTPRPSSQEMQAQVEATENRMGEKLDELGRRLSPRQINDRMKQRISSRPYRSGLVAMGLGVLSGLFLARDSHR